MATSLDNHGVAARLDRIAELLEAQAANPFRVQAYRHAATEAMRCARPLGLVAFEGGVPALKEALSVGASLARVILELLETGHVGLLDRLEGEVSPEEVFMSLPGMGVALATRAHNFLGVETLAELEAAAADGRLQRVPGFGPRRARLVREALASRLAEIRRRVPSDGVEPSVDLLLSLDSDYRTKARLGELPRIRPRRFNPTGESWLPIWHVDCGGWAFTVMFSNTARAHQRQATHDWVVIYFEKDGKESQCTVVTEIHGALAARRVVRGRERECAHFYYEHPAPIGAPPETSEQLPMH